MKHNGWTNYETWSVHVEITGDMDFDYEIDAESLKDLVEEIVFEDDKPSLMSSFAHSFLSEVNYYELAEHYEDERLGGY